MNFYKHYIGDYQRDTMRLSMTEDGAYRRLLDEYYATEEPLPLDRAECYRAARATTPDEQAAVDKVLDRYFEQRDDGFHSRKADELIAKASTQAETNRRIAEEREQKRKKDDKATNRDTNRATDRKTTDHTNDQPNQTPDTRHQKDKDSVPDGTGAAAPKDPPAVLEQAKATDPAKPCYDIGKPLLAKYGIADRKAGGLITKWLKEHPPEIVLSVFQHAGAQERHDIVAFVTGCLKDPLELPEFLKRGQNETDQTGPGRSAERVARAVAAIEGANRQDVAGAGGNADPALPAVPGE